MYLQKYEDLCTYFFDIENLLRYDRLSKRRKYNFSQLAPEIGCVFVFLAASHTLSHMCDFSRLANADTMDIDALFEGKDIDIPESPSARWGWALGTRAGITGIIMVVCLIISYSFIFHRWYECTKKFPFCKKRKAKVDFNLFWYSHHLLLVMLICLCIHGTGNLLEPPKSVYWLIGPLLLYALPR